MAKYIKETTTDTDTGVVSFTVEDVQPLNGRDFTLSELQGYVDGNIEIIDLPDGKIMVVNDDYLFNGSNVNPLAGAYFDGGAVVCGSVLICDAEQVL